MAMHDITGLLDYLVITEALMCKQQFNVLAGQNGANLYIAG